jgi:beta-lactamase regulating signal transducer with metallopeptidase domain
MMVAELLRALAISAIASSAAVLMVGLLRKPLRAAVGARASFWLWLLVPVVVLGSLLPAPTQILQASSEFLPDQIRSTISAALVTSVSRESAISPSAVLASWAVGACLMFGLLLRRQRSFTRSLGTVVPDDGGFQRGNVIAPMLVGAFNPKIVVPMDFESRYSKLERDLVLAHERAHMCRRDGVINAFASGWLCLFWFNPLIYCALSWIRIDQELACDALVLAQRNGAKRCYANALLKTQLATESGWRVPVGCNWQSNYSLKERIVMLKRPLPGVSRQMFGIALIVGLAGSAGYTAWASQATESQGPHILVDMKVEVSSSKTNEVFAFVTRYLVRSGELPADMKTPPAAIACTPYLPAGLEKSAAWAAMEARGIPLPPEGSILMDCTIREDGEVVATPAVIAFDGKPMTIEAAGRDKTKLYKIEMSASTSKERIAAAKNTAVKP